MGVDFRFIGLDDPLYPQERALRYDILRAPLGYPPGSEIFEFEAESLHLVAVDMGAVVGCVLFYPDGSGGGRLFQMAVRKALQRSGLGSQLVLTLERELARRGVQTVILHARQVVQGFYEQLGYTLYGEPYLEVGIPHVSMKRSLVQASGNL